MKKISICLLYVAILLTLFSCDDSAITSPDTSIYSPDTSIYSSNPYM